jgi:hypothetical protein
MSTVAEIVTFTLQPGTDPAQFIAAARQTDRWLASRPGYLGRTLSQGADGQWTDHVLWSDMARAQEAAEALMSALEGQAMMSAIAPASVRMRHEPVQMMKGA